jgi:hypothetical protein
MLQILYRASFFLYELSFLAFAAALAVQAGLMRRLGRTLRLPPFWLGPAAAAVLMLACALLHFYAYHVLSPEYLASGSRGLLFQMYALKTLSMSGVLLAGLSLVLGAGAYQRATTR